MRHTVGITNRKKRKSPTRKSPARRSPSKRVAPARKKSSKRTFKYRKVKKYSQVKRKGFKTGSGKSNLTKSRKLKKTTSKVLGIFLGIIMLGTLGGTIFLGATLASIKSSLPDPDELVEWESAESTKIFDRGGPEDGVLLYTIYGDQNREFSDIKDYPEHTKWALLAAEDVEFYDHKGLDIPGIAKATYQNLVLHQTRGASTISQQLVRNTLLVKFLGDKAYERTLMRKIKEALITMQLEQGHSKDDILQMYMNEIPLGGTNYGFRAAAKSYFGKDINELTLAESAMLAGLIQAPGAWSPLFGSQPEEAVRRQHFVLDQMYDKRDYIKKVSPKHGEMFEITEELIEEAKAEELQYREIKIDIKAPHFVFYVKQKLIEEYGIERVERGGLIVTTTLDYDLQQIAEQEITAGVDKFRTAYNVHNGSMVVIDPKTGQMLALVGSYNYWAEPDPKVDGNVNIATALRQMGSSVKPYTYLTAFHQGYSPALLAPDIPLNFGGYKIDNWDGRYQGLILARRALVESRNISATYVMDLIGGPDAFIKTAEALGITTLTDRDRYGLSLTLGAGEMKLLEHTAAFGVFANGGILHETTPIMKVEKGDEVLQEWKQEDEKRVWDEKEIYLLNWTLCDIPNQGRLMSEYYSVGGQRLCGKTGTTNGPRDLTALLYYPNLVVGVWTGNNNNLETIGTQGQGWSTSVPLPIAHSFMTRVVGSRFDKEWYSRPAGIVSGTVCRDTGLLAKSDSACSKVSSIFIQGHLPPVDNSYVKKPICKETGLVATNESEAKAMSLIEYKTFLKITLPISKHQGALDAWLKNHSKYSSYSSIPSEGVCPLHLGPGNAPTISFTSPASGQEFNPGDSVSLKVSVNSLNGVTKVEFFFDGNLIQTDTSAPYSTTYTIPSTAAVGGHTFSAKVYDTNGKTSTATVTIKVKSSAPTISVAMTAPGDGSTITLPENISASITGAFGTVTSVSFIVSGPSGGTISASTSDGGQNWSASWNSGNPGEYTVHAEVQTSGGDMYFSNWITVTVE